MIFDIIQTATSVIIQRYKLPFQVLDFSATLKFDKEDQAIEIEDQNGRRVSIKSYEVDNTQIFGQPIQPFSGSALDLINLLLSDFFDDPRLDANNLNLSSDDISNNSSVTGATVTDALNSLSGGSSIFGQAFQFAEDDIESVTTSQAYQNKLTLLKTDLVVSATYKVEYSAELSSSTTNRSILCRFQINAATEAELEIENKDNSNYYAFSGHKTFIALSTTASFSIDWAKVGGNAQLARIRRARLNIFRVS